LFVDIGARAFTWAFRLAMLALRAAFKRFSRLFVSILFDFELGM